MRARTWLLAMSSLLVGCAARPAPTTAPTPRVTGEAAARAQTLCPLTTPGARVGLEETEQGGTLVFVAPPADVPEIRSRVLAMAELYRKQTATRPLTWGYQGEAELVAMPRADAVLELLPSGARLGVAAADPNESAALREHLAAQVRHLQGGWCLVLEVLPEGVAQGGHPSRIQAETVAISSGVR